MGRTVEKISVRQVEALLKKIEHDPVALDLVARFVDQLTADPFRRRRR